MTTIKLTRAVVRKWLPPRKKDAHKGDFGHVMIVAGSRGMAGAAALCAWGALRGGAGLVTVATPESQQPVVAKHIRPEAMTLALPETSKGTLEPDSVPTVLDFIQKRRVSTLALGPGLSREPETKMFARALADGVSRNPRTLKALVLDADGFTALTPDCGQDPLMDLSVPAIVTPHAGEMAAFCGTLVETVLKDRVAFSEKFAKLYRLVCVLKGPGTVVSDGQKTFVNSTGNPGMATGGSGDVLTGLVAALSAQTDSLIHAAALGAYLHGLAGDLAAKNKTQTALIAGDIAEALPSALRKTL